MNMANIFRAKKSFWKKCWIFLLIFAFLIPCMQGCGNSNDSKSNHEETETIEWSNYSLHEQLPEPKSTKGMNIYDRSDSLDLTVCDVSQKEYDEYVKKCEFEYGYSLEKDKSNSSFMAESENGYELYIHYYSDDKEMHISLSAISEEKETPNQPITDEKETSSQPISEPSKTTESSDSDLVNGMHKDFKEAMDSYEKFMDKYVAFMKKYAANPSDPNLLLEYSDYLSEYADMVEEFDDWDSEDLNSAELAYYLDVQTRVNKKLLEVSGN